MKTVAFIILLIMVNENLFGQKTDDQIINLLKTKYSSSQFEYSTEIVRFNEDTIIVSGYLTDLSSAITRYEHDVIYKTVSGGKDWKSIKYGGDSWIYTCASFSNGKMWMGGSDNFIYYSEDYGEKWMRFSPPFTPINRVLKIYMVNDKFGIAGGLSNGLAITFDNWKTTKQIPTPLDQNKFKISSGSSRDRISNIGIIDSLIVINQNDYIFYSNLNQISWKEFKIPAANFSIDERKRTIDLVSRDRKHFVINSSLNLISKYTAKDYEYFNNSELANISDVKDFFSSPIKGMLIYSKVKEFRRPDHMADIYIKKMEAATVRFKKNKYIFESENSRRKEIDFNPLKFKEAIFEGSSKSLNQLKEKFSFTIDDFKNYNEYLGNQFKYFSTREEQGENPTYIINPVRIKEYKESQIENIFESVDIEDLYRKNFDATFFLQTARDSIEVIFCNNADEELKISNYNSIFLSLPWTITYKTKTYRSYNPEITYFMREIIPSEFSNYNMLLGGKLIYKLFEQDISNKIDY